MRQCCSTCKYFDKSQWTGDYQPCYDVVGWCKAPLPESVEGSGATKSFILGSAGKDCKAYVVNALA